MCGITRDQGRKKTTALYSERTYSALEAMQSMVLRWEEDARDEVWRSSRVGL